jgi:hypothetical protein
VILRAGCVSVTSTLSNFRNSWDSALTIRASSPLSAWAPMLMRICGVSPSKLPASEHIVIISRVFIRVWSVCAAPCDRGDTV